MERAHLWQIWELTKEMSQSTHDCKSADSFSFFLPGEQKGSMRVGTFISTIVCRGNKGKIASVCKN